MGFFFTIQGTYPGPHKANPKIKWIIFSYFIIYRYLRKKRHTFITCTVLDVFVVSISEYDQAMKILSLIYFFTFSSVIITTKMYPMCLIHTGKDLFMHHLRFSFYYCPAEEVC